MFVLLLIIAFISASNQNDRRLLFGKDASEGRFPYHLAIIHDNIIICGGSIISEKWGITAAHCVMLSQEQLTLQAGSVYSLKGETIEIKSIIIHPDYNTNIKEPEQFNNDIGLLRFKIDLDFKKLKNIAPIQLPDENYRIPPNTKVICLGWGFTDKGTQPDQLQYIRLRVTDIKKCADEYKSTPTSLKLVICASHKTKDACRGDSGGPLILNKILIGIVAGGNSCTIIDPTKERLGIYTSVIKKRLYIKYITGL